MWQLATAKVNKENAGNVDQFVTRLLRLEFVRVILALQEIRSWDAEEMHVLGCVVYGSEFGLTPLLVSDRLSNAQKTWRSEEGCTAVLLAVTMVMSVHAFELGKRLWRIRNIQ